VSWEIDSERWVPKAHEEWLNEGIFGAEALVDSGAVLAEES
jgi:hypothetical protein